MTSNIRVDLDVPMTTRDGVVLRADVTRPEGPGRWPAIVSRTPYGKSNKLLRFLSPIEAARHGYAFVRQDVRGRFSSDGEWQFLDWGGIERTDGYDTIEWVSAQPWCDGNVGMIGSSYEANIQVTAAREQPPHLRAIAPSMGGGGYDTVRRNAVSLETISLGWTSLMALDVIDKRVASGAATADQVAGDVALALAVQAGARDAVWTLPLSQLPPLTIPGMPTYDELVELWDRAARAIAGREDEIAVPALSVSGWFDSRAGAHQFRALRERGASQAARAETKLLFGPWGHSSQEGSMGEWGFGQLGSADGAAVSAAHLAFFDRNVRGDDRVAALPNVRFFVMGMNEWRDADDWPIPGTEYQRLYLHARERANSVRGSGTLEPREPDADGGADHFTYDPADPTPSFGGRAMYIGGSTVHGPFDQARIERRDDVLVYTSSAMSGPLEIAGDIELQLWVSSSAPDTDFVAKLCDVDPDGISCNIADGFVRARHRHGWDREELLEPGEVYELTIDLGPTAHVFRPGHCVRVQVASSAFPRWERNLNTGNPPADDAFGVAARQTVHHDARRPSHVVLPVVNQADTRPTSLSALRRP